MGHERSNVVHNAPLNHVVLLRSSDHLIYRHWRYIKELLEATQGVMTNILRWQFRDENGLLCLRTKRVKQKRNKMKERND